jgi:hypothetical protein
MDEDKNVQNPLALNANFHQFEKSRSLFKRRIKGVNQPVGPRIEISQETHFKPAIIGKFVPNPAFESVQ